MLAYLQWKIQELLIQKVIDVERRMDKSKKGLHR